MPERLFLSEQRPSVEVWGFEAENQRRKAMAAPREGVDMRRELRKAIGLYYAEMKERAVKIPVASGLYSADALFDTRSGAREQRIPSFFLDPNSNLFDLIGRAYAEIQKEDLHNFRLLLDENTATEEIDYCIRDEKGGAVFDGKCWVDTGGHIVWGDE